MSFTCTRYEDSIPCETSPNYFYLNKRNGDPKAHFLTDQDIIKTSNSNRNSVSYHNNLIDERQSYKEIIEPKLSSSLQKDVLMGINDSKPPIVPSMMAYVKEDNSGKSLMNLYKDQHHAPYEMSDKYLSNMKPGVRYTNTMKMNYPSYKPAYDPLPPYSRSGQIESERGPILPKYQSLIQSQEPVNSKIDQMFVPDDRALDDKMKSPYNYPGPHLSRAIKPTKKTFFTPATFSQMYMENQKASKYGQMRPSHMAFNNNSYETIMRPKKQQHHIRDNELNNKMALYSEVSSKPFPKFPSKYYDTSKYQEIKSDHYTVPNTIRIVEPNENVATSNDKAKNLRYATLSEESEPQPAEPVKMGFMDKNGNNEAPENVRDFQNYKVVKQVKGKNLLIDPSLENDPARDNIIAQVLEMLSKYNWQY